MTTKKIAAAAALVTAMFDPERDRVVADIAQETDIFTVARLAAEVVTRCADGREVLQRIALAAASLEVDPPRRPALGAFRQLPSW